MHQRRADAAARGDALTRADTLLLVGAPLIGRPTDGGRAAPRARARHVPPPPPPPFAWTACRPAPGLFLIPTAPTEGA